MAGKICDYLVGSESLLLGWGDGGGHQGRFKSSYSGSKGSGGKGFHSRGGGSDASLLEIAVAFGVIEVFAKRSEAVGAVVGAAKVLEALCFWGWCGGLDGRRCCGLEVRDGNKG